MFNEQTCLQPLSSVSPLSPHRPDNVRGGRDLSSHFIQQPFLQIKKWKHREGKWLAQGHTVSGWTSREFSSVPSITIDQGLLALQQESVITPIERKWKLLHRVWLCDPHGPYSPWSSPGQNTRVGSHSLLQEIFPTHGLNSGLLHCRWILDQLSHQGSPIILLVFIYAFNWKK